MIFKKLNLRFRRILKIGVWRSVRIVIDRSFLKLLQIFYGFHPWHVDSPLSARPYRYVVAEISNSVNPQCVVEVGCGLGSILSLVVAPERYGYDVDSGAVRAARMIRERGIDFVLGDMNSVSQQHITVLILCNWIHEFSPQQLDSWLTPLLPRTSFLVLDAIDSDGDKGYKFKHDFSFLDFRDKCVTIKRASDEGRSFFLYEIIK